MKRLVCEGFGRPCENDGPLTRTTVGRKDAMLCVWCLSARTLRLRALREGAAALARTERDLGELTRGSSTGGTFRVA